LVAALLGKSIYSTTALAELFGRPDLTLLYLLKRMVGAQRQNLMSLILHQRDHLWNATGYPSTTDEIPIGAKTRVFAMTALSRSDCAAFASSQYIRAGLD
jgi:hypothetical protein